MQSQGLFSHLTLHPSARSTVGSVRISELADRVGVATSTVRYYERVGLLTMPERTDSGYRDYDDEAANRLLFIARARKMGLSCEQIVELLPIWDGANCSAAHERVGILIDEKRAEINERIRELKRFASQLDAARDVLLATAPPEACRTDLSCCMPETEGNAVAVELAPKRTR